MDTLQVLRWKISYDKQKTADAYCRLKQGSPHDCDCMPCRNFSEALKSGKAYSPEILKLLYDLGIDHKKAMEVYTTSDETDKLLDYGIWFYFVGNIDAGKDGKVETAPNSYRLDLEVFDGRFNICLTQKVAVVPEAFKGLPLVELNLFTQLPWLL